MAASRIGAMIAPATAYGLEKWNWGVSVLDHSALMWTFACVSAVSCVCAWSIPIETRGMQLQDSTEDDPASDYEYNQVSTDDVDEKGGDSDHNSI